MDDATYAKLKARADKARQLRDQAAGKLAGVMERLKRDFGCTTIEAARTKSEQLARKADEAEAEFSRIADRFKESYNEKLAE